MRFSKIAGIAMGIAMVTGCTTNPGDTKDLKQHTGSVHIKTRAQSAENITEGRHLVPIHTIKNTPYIALEDFAKATGFHSAWLRDGSYGVGDNDAAWVFHTGESAVQAGGHSATMPAPAVKEGEQLYIPASGLKTLFGDVTVFTVETDNVAFFPRPTANETGVNGKNQDFADAPSVKPAPDSAPGSPAASEAKRTSAAAAAGSVSIEAIAQADADKLLAFAKKFLGIKYEFGTGEYKDSGTFDCSSFTQHVYAHFGITLPRIARQQAEEGKYVDRDSLQIGDLLFFYVPDRFKSNEIVGHVGIYMGGGDMIHASPKPEDGVQITPINKEYWKDTFLYAKRYS